MSAQEFADRLHVSVQQVNRYELGTNGVDDAGALRIARVLDLPEVEVRRGMGLWVGDDTGHGVSTLQAIQMDPLLDDVERTHFVNQYELLTRLSRYRREAELTDDEAVEIVEREHPGAIAAALGENGSNPKPPPGKGPGKATRRQRVNKDVTRTDETG